MLVTLSQAPIVGLLLYQKLNNYKFLVKKGEEQSPNPISNNLETKQIKIVTGA